MEERAKKLPALMVGWDADSQSAVLKFDTKEFRSWDMVLAALDAAKRQAEFNLNMQRAVAAQQAQAQAMQEAAVAQRLADGNAHGRGVH